MREKISIFRLHLIVMASCAFYAELVVWGVEFLTCSGGTYIFFMRLFVYVVFVFLSIRYAVPVLRKVW